MDSNQGNSRRIGQGMIWAGWLLLLGLLTLYFNDWLQTQHNPNRQVTTVVGSDGTAEVVLKRNRAGHYVASGFINGQPVELLVDTGASDVSLPVALAERLGLQVGAATTFQTANGTATGYRTQLDSLRLGELELRGVPASIHPGLAEDTVLLGMSVLRHLEFRQQGGTLILRGPG